MDQPGGEVPTCPVCASRHVARAVVLRSDYRCPDCSALFDSDERIVADPRPWVDPRTHANLGLTPDPEGSGPDERRAPIDRKKT